MIIELSKSIRPIALCWTQPIHKISKLGESYIMMEILTLVLLAVGWVWSCSVPKVQYSGMDIILPQYATVYHNNFRSSLTQADELIEDGISPISVSTLLHGVLSSDFFVASCFLTVQKDNGPWKHDVSLDQLLSRESLPGGDRIQIVKEELDCLGPNQIAISIELINPVMR